MRLTEQNCPLLRYLKWTGNLDDHPEMRRSRKDPKAMRLPFLDFTPKEYACLRTGTGNLGEMKDVRDRIFRNWPELQPAFSSNIEILSRNFFLALDRSYDAFLSPELFAEITGIHQDTMLLPDGAAVCYSFEMADPYRNADGNLCYGIAGDIMQTAQDGRTLLYAAVGDGPAWDAGRACATERTDERIFGLFDLVLVCILFKKYADVQTIDAKSIRHPKEDGPEVRTTLDGIRYLDASWYTTIVRTEGFGVKGHFRLQPCGKGRKEKKLIYINEFRKHGYVRRAKLLQEG